MNFHALCSSKTWLHIENIFLTTDNKYYHVSSSAIRELAQFGGDITHLVPHCVELAIHEKIKRVPTSK